MDLNLRVPAEFAVLIQHALEHETDGTVYAGLVVGLGTWEGDDLLVPIVTMEQAVKGNYSVTDNPVVVYRIKMEKVI